MSLPIRLTEEKHAISLTVGERQLIMHSGDITQLSADALVCPVDQNMDFRSGVARIIIQYAGNEIRREKPVFPEPLGKVVVLPGGRLRVKYIFMTVLLGEKDHARIHSAVRDAVDRAIHYAEFLRLKSLAFPVLGCPRSQPPYSLVAKAMLEEVTQYFQRRNTKLKLILFSAYNTDAFDALRKEARDIASL